MSGAVWRPGDLRPEHYGSFFSEFISRVASPISAFELLAQLKEKRSFQRTKIAAVVYRQLAAQFYSEEDFKLFTQRVGELPVEKIRSEIKQWIDERNNEGEGKSLSLEISAEDLPLVPAIFKTLKILHRLIIKNVDSLTSLNLTDWKGLRRVRAIPSPDSVESGYLADDEREDHPSKRLSALNRNVTFSV